MACRDCGRRCHGLRCKWCERDQRQSSYVEPTLRDWHDTPDEERDDNA